MASSGGDNTSLLTNGSAPRQMAPGLPEVTPEQAMYLDHMSYWIYAVLTNIVVVLGLVGNLLVIIILSQRAMRTSTNFYLSALAVWDSILLLCTVFLVGLKSLQFYTRMVHSYVVAYVYPIGLTAQTATIWLTVSFTVERYIAVCHPLRAASMCTLSRAKIVITGVALGSMLYNIPRWFDYRTKVMAGNVTQVVITRTPFSQNPLYMEVYYSWLYVPIMCIVPLLVLSVLNTFLILAVRQSQRSRLDMNVRQSRENNVTIMLVSVVIVFIICQVPALVYNLAWAINDGHTENSFGYMALSIIRNFLVNLNSAVNFILYCALGQKFRRIFLHTFCRRCVKEAYIPMSGVHQHTTVVSVQSQRRHLAMGGGGGGGGRGAGMGGMGGGRGGNKVPKKGCSDGDSTSNHHHVHSNSAKPVPHHGPTRSAGQESGGVKSGGCDWRHSPLPTYTTPTTTTSGVGGGGKCGGKGPGGGIKGVVAGYHPGDREMCTYTAPKAAASTVITTATAGGARDKWKRRQGSPLEPGVGDSEPRNDMALEQLLPERHQNHIPMYQRHVANGSSVPV